jgi:hypothetical protein
LKRLKYSFWVCWILFFLAGIQGGVKVVDVVDDTSVSPPTARLAGR